VGRGEQGDEGRVFCGGINPVAADMSLTLLEGWGLVISGLNPHVLLNTHQQQQSVVRGEG